jgi:hypothetical protein
MQLELFVLFASKSTKFNSKILAFAHFLVPKTNL